jgi:dGTPase
VKIINVYDTEPLRYPAPYAALSKASRGRRITIPRNPYRTDYQRDRDRIIHCSAFRRLQHKTQVFANFGDEKDHYRTRLTHTIEVAQISRTIARLLGLNEDLAEAVALAHDLGHTPFGHAGEEVLNNLLVDFGGFNHNMQSLRVVDFLEKRYPEYFGLNLTFELRESIIKHEAEHEITVPEEFYPEDQPPLEGQLVNLADEIAYSGHDVDDGLAADLFSLDDLQRLDLLQELMVEIENSLKDKSEGMVRKALVRGLVDLMVVDLVREIKNRLEVYNINSMDEIRHSKYRLIGFSKNQVEFNTQLREFLQHNMYNNPELDDMHRRSREIIAFLYTNYNRNPDNIPIEFLQRYPNTPVWQLAADYVAGMTDRFALAEFNHLQ